MSTTSSIDAWAALVAAAREYARLAFGDEPQALTLHLSRCGKTKLPLPCCLPGSEPAVEQVEPASEQVNGTIAQRISQVLTEEPQTRERVARVAGCTFNSHFNRVVAEMVRQGQARQTPDGICCPPGEE